MQNLTKQLNKGINIKMNWFLFFSFLFASNICLAQTRPTTAPVEEKLAYEEFEMTEGDTTYVMKKYFLLTYYKGDKRDQSEAQAEEIQKGHLDHMNTLADENKISIAGPFGHDGQERGIIIFNAYSIEEAETLAKKDPAVIAGRLKYTLYPIWLAKGSTLD